MILFSHWVTQISGLTKQECNIWSMINYWCLLWQMLDKREKHQQQGEGIERWMYCCSNKSKYNNWFLITENESNHAVTCVGIIQDKSTNLKIDNTMVTHIINEVKQHHPYTSNKSNLSKIGVISDFVSVSKKQVIHCHYYKKNSSQMLMLLFTYLNFSIWKKF